jgi:hypothetical protein
MTQSIIGYSVTGLVFMTRTSRYRRVGYYQIRVMITGPGSSWLGYASWPRLPVVDLVTVSGPISAYAPISACQYKKTTRVQMPVVPTVTVPGSGVTAFKFRTRRRRSLALSDAVTGRGPGDRWPTGRDHGVRATGLIIAVQAISWFDISIRDRASHGVAPTVTVTPGPVRATVVATSTVTSGYWSRPGWLLVATGGYWLLLVAATGGSVTGGY